jgi:hypothetical protein
MTYDVTHHRFDAFYALSSHKLLFPEKGCFGLIFWFKSIASVVFWRGFSSSFITVLMLFLVVICDVTLAFLMD